MKHSPHLSPTDAQRIHDKIGVHPYYPKPGVTFRDILPACADAELVLHMAYAMAAPYRSGRAVTEVTHVVGVESRGYLFASMLAGLLKAGVVPVRKAAERPWKTAREPYKLEYGEATLEIALGLLDANSRVIIVDDLLALGGTAGAASRLCQRQGATVISVDVIVELDGLGGRAALSPLPVHALLTL